MSEPEEIKEPVTCVNCGNKFCLRKCKVQNRLETENVFTPLPRSGDAILQCPHCEYWQPNDYDV